ncbi:signal peptidase I [Dactylosporangium sp. CS-047395]|uniref:signal peptidase I n=1 Tax=Dactylosporangium sp. CS-047395 TaxID=3239936 RepID=UPI003D8A777F
MTALHARPARVPWLLRPVAVGVLSFVLCLFAMTLVPLAFGWSPSVVLSGSMQPSITPGDVVISAPLETGDLVPGRVIRFRDPARPGRYLVHRIVAVQPDHTLVTQGDANAAADSTPVPAGDVTGVARLRVPWIGLPALWWRDGHHVRVVLLAGMLALLWCARHDGPVTRPQLRRTSADPNRL